MGPGPLNTWDISVLIVALILPPPISRWVRFNYIPGLTVSDYVAS